MGIVAKQSIKGSVYIYIGAVLGFINTGLLMPKFFSLDQVGLVNLLIAVSLIFSSFSGLGIATVINRLFPYFRNDSNNHNGILPFSYLITLTGVIILLLVFILLKPFLIESNLEKSYLFTQNIYYIPILFILTAFYIITDVYNKSLFDATLGIFLRDFFVRLLNLLLIVSFIFNMINFDNFVLLYVIIYTSPLFVMVSILIIRKQIQLTYINWNIISKYKREIFMLALFGLIAGFSGTAVINIDKYMINHFIGLEKAAIYSVSFSFGVIILMPSRALKKISSIVIAEAWKSNDTKLINNIYKKSTVIQLIIALLIFIGIWANIHNIFRILPDYKEGMLVILLIGGAYVIEMLSGVSDTIIVTSKHYKVFSYIMVIKIVFVIVFNIIFIPIWGLTGGAIASFITITLTSFLRFLFIFFKYKLQPYNYKHLLIIIIGAFTFLIGLLIPEFENLIIDIIIRSSVITLIYFFIIISGRFSEEINKSFGVIKRKLKL